MPKHEIDPIFAEDSRILILGSFPSVLSREAAFYYAHPQNRFWKILARIFEEEVPVTVNEKKDLLLRHQLALWDVIASCRIEGSADQSISDVRVNDLQVIMAKADIEKILVNGRTAERYYRKYLEEKTKMKAVCLPSSSPANAAYSLERLVEIWKESIL